MWWLRERVHPVLTDEGGAILDEHTGRWTQLTPTAAAAVMLLLACPTQEEAAGRFAERYAIPGEQAAADVQSVADALIVQGLARSGPEPTRRRRSWWGWRR
ncbi:MULTISPECIES: PqqD family peptide modification chaperone [Streptomyces]|uniref:PqqD family peptide modification chaperone n=1 Tax=Streptomyces TaxID=1883 RepID=UPI000B9EBD02|nr:PqqD family peptide modification chaperone [Streptomyces kasugaensis]WSK14666.1 PqqD family peptide modification chaperone [Streptomyces celluloflavus]